MPPKRVAVIGSGVVGTALAHALLEAGGPGGVRVEIFERGRSYPYPHAPQFERQVELRSSEPLYPVPPGLVRIERSGDYPVALETEMDAVVGGSAVRWEAICLRRPPAEMATRTLYGYGADWPFGYDELEPWYGRAEALLGVAGTDRDNPFAPPRSRPHPLPPFELAWDDRWLAERLAADGLALHTTPQARTREPYDRRAACVNFGTCRVCPIGARYSPNLHLERLLAGGRVRLHTGTAVRRVLVDGAGRTRGVVARPVGDAVGRREREHPADAVVVAAGALETPRLLLLSATGSHPDGLGNRSGHVGRHLAFHHMWLGRLRFRQALYPGRFGGWTGQSHQFLDPPGRGRHGGVKVEMSSRRAYATYEPVPVWETPGDVLSGAATARDVERALAPMAHWRPITFHAEASPGVDDAGADTKLLSLGTGRDRFGDPVAHVRYGLDDFDRETHRHCRRLFERFRRASGAVEGELAPEELYYSGFHHMGTCRMSGSAEGGVTDGLGRVHGVPGLWVAGGALFAGSGTVNPTLTMVALALRSGSALGESLR